MTRSIRRVVAAGVFAALGLAAFAGPAQAADTSELGCDTAAVSAAVDTAKADVVAARKAYTSFVKHGSKPVKEEKSGKGSKGHHGPKAKVAHAKGHGRGHSEDREASRAERRELKATWEAAKAALHELKAYADECEAADETGTDETGTDETGTDETGTDETGTDGSDDTDTGEPTP